LRVEQAGLVLAAISGGPRSVARKLGTPWIKAAYYEIDEV
jgi:hypothetical protein